MNGDHGLHDDPGWAEAVHLAARLGAERLAVLRRVLGNPHDVTARAEGRTAAHQLAGSLGILGSAEASEAAGRLEELLDGDGAPDPRELEEAYAALELLAGPAIDRGRQRESVAGTTASDAPPADDAILGARILAVDDDPSVVEHVASIFTANGARVLRAADGREALHVIESEVVDLVVSDVNMPDMSGFELVRALRARPETLALPLLFLTTRSSSADMVQGLGLGADDYLTKPVEPTELIARARTRLVRAPRTPLAEKAERRVVSPTAFRRVLAREQERTRREGTTGCVAVITVSELEALRRRLGRRFAERVVSQVGEVVAALLEPLDVAANTEGGAISVLLGATDAEAAPRRLEMLAQTIVARGFGTTEEPVTVTPSTGWLPLDGAPDAAALVEAASLAAVHAQAHLDLVPLRYTPAMARARPRLGVRLGRLRTPVQLALTLVLGLVVPYAVYALLDAVGYDITGIVYLVVVGALVVTGILIWAEGIAALRPPTPPELEIDEWPPATAIIAAYLPNEAATLLDTVRAFLGVDYPSLRVILAYNTPQSMPIEAELRVLARRDPRLIPLRVEHSQSKAQNVNAALAFVEGEMVGVFDADHHPAPDAFRRAWRWLAGGYDVVQGHNVVRNGTASRVARTVAVEFESIYGVSHPGRTRLHAFGIFGGSNGYWRASLLRATRMRGSMLTEDIDSSIRAVENGCRIVSDPRIVSRELATTTVRALWNQRMRWAQGWFQVSLRHTWRAVRSPQLSVRQRLGVLHLLAWREVYPWIALQIVPLVAFWVFGDRRDVDWAVPIFVFTTVFTLSVGPGQTLFAYLVADREIRPHRWWFLAYLVVASLVYTEFKNMIARLAQIKEMMGERDWRVTPRTPEAVRDFT